MSDDLPKLSVFNRQRRLAVDCRELADFLGRIRERLALSMSASFVLISDRAMCDLHRRYSGVAGPTDVLSFPTDAETRDAEPYMGDVFISVETALRQRPDALPEELKVLALHGLLHLLGYDHETDNGEMAEFEARLRREAGIS